MMSEEDEQNILNLRSITATGKGTIPVVDVPDSPVTKVSCPFSFLFPWRLVVLFSYDYVFCSNFVLFLVLNLFFMFYIHMLKSSS